MTRRWVEMNVKSVDLPPPKWLYAALAMGTVACYWLPRLFRGFWVDEAGTYWIAHNGFSRVWAQMQIYPGQSVIYSHLSSLLISEGPYKEALLRLPSILGMLVSAWLLFKLTERIAGEGSGVLAVIPFLCSPEMMEAATNARPYGLAIAMVLGSFWSLREWVHTQTNRSLIVYAICSCLVVYFHYLFGMIFLVQAVYLLAARRCGRVFSWTRVLAAGGFILAAAFPLVQPLLTIAHQSGSFAGPVLPMKVLLTTFYPLGVLSVAAVGFVLYRFLYPKWFGSWPWLEREDLVLLAAWLLLGPMLSFLLTRLTGYALLNSRYVLYALLPLFILLAWSLRQIGNERARLALLFAVALNAAAYGPWMRDVDDGWRRPLDVVRQMAGADAPLLVRSGFMESTGRDLRGEPKRSSYLFAPLVAYPVPNEIIPVPFFVDHAAERQIESEIQERAASHKRFGLVANTGSDVLKVLPAWFRNHGYQVSAREVSVFTIMLFERPR